MGINSIMMVGIGAAIGAWLRWTLALMMNAAFPLLPLGTLCANLIGGLLMGMMVGVLSGENAISQEMRLFITTGFLGGLTTFSTFSGESLVLFTKGEYVWALLHTVIHVLGSLSMAALGMYLVQLLRS